MGKKLKRATTFSSRFVSSEIISTNCERYAKAATSCERENIADEIVSEFFDTFP